MDTLGGVIGKNSPGLYSLCVGTPDEIYSKIRSYNLIDRDRLFSKIHELEFHSKESYMFHEIVELVYLENKKPSTIPFNRTPSLQHGEYTLMEVINFLSCYLEDEPSSYIFGHASTNPIILDFIQSISLKTLPERLYEVKNRITIDPKSVTRALKKGVPYKLMEKILLKRCKFWIFDLYPLAFGNRKIGEFFLKLSSSQNALISMETILGLINLDRFLVGLSNFSSKRVAVEKLLLIIYFPEKVQFIYDSFHPIFAFKDLLMERLTEWRRVIFQKIDWESIQIAGVKLLNCNFKFTKDYYEGYKENSMFDDFILALNGPKYRDLLEEFFVAKRVPRNFFLHYKEDIIKKEFQGTVYSIIRDKYKLSWNDPINPLSQEITPKYENECVKLSLWGSPAALWLRSRYINTMLKAPFPISRLAFDLRLPMDSFIIKLRRSDGKASIKATNKMYKSLANYCQPRKGYLKKWDYQAVSSISCHLFDEIWRHNIEHCDFIKSLEVIRVALERGQVDFLTERSLLYILKSIVSMHYSAEVAMNMDFTIWTNSLKDQLTVIFDELDGYGSRENGGNNTPPGTQHTQCCIIG